MSAESASPQDNERPLIAVSRCLLGESVRYDGSDRRVAWITDVLSVHCDFLRLCPEVEAGLAVPRPAVRLVAGEGSLRALGVADPDLDVTRELSRYSTGKVGLLGRVDGIILKAGSPSCGLTDTPRFDSSGREIGSGAGLFSRVAVAVWPALPATDEVALETEVARVAFLMQVFRYRCRRHSRASTQGRVLNNP